MDTISSYLFIPSVEYIMSIEGSRWVKQVDSIERSILREGTVNALRMYCIDTPRVPESSDASTFHCLYD